MLMPAAALPVTPVRIVAPLQRSAGHVQAGEDRGGSRRSGGGRFERRGRRDAPSRDPAAALSSSAVLSAPLDLPRRG